MSAIVTPHETNVHPSPGLLMDAMFAYHLTYAVTTAVELGLFTAIEGGATTPVALAQKCQSDLRATRILLDYLTVKGFLTKTGDAYANTVDTSAFLVQGKQKYLGGITGFMGSPNLIHHCDRLTDTVRTGTVGEMDTTDPSTTVWKNFATAMGSLMIPVAILVAENVTSPEAGPQTILDVASSHGMYGTFCLLSNRQAKVIANDWPNIVPFSKAGAESFGVGDRLETLGGSAFDVTYPTGLDTILVPNFIHHFDIPTNTKFLRKCFDALKPAGKVVVVEFVVNEDRVSPPMQGAFAIQMLVGTPKGDTYTFAEIAQMLTDAGFGPSSRVDSETIPSTLVIAAKG